MLTPPWLARGRNKGDFEWVVNMLSARSECRMHMHTALMSSLPTSPFRSQPGDSLLSVSVTFKQLCPSPSHSGVTVLPRQPSSGAFAGLATGLWFPRLMGSGVSQSPLILNTTVVEVDQRRFGKGTGKLAPWGLTWGSRDITWKRHSHSLSLEQSSVAEPVYESASQGTHSPVCPVLDTQIAPS